MPERFLGRTLGKYRIDALLGSGGFAWVYRAFDPELEIAVALKVLKPQFAGDPDFEERFRREAATAAKLRHPNIVTIYAVGREQDAVYFAMDHLPQNLAARLAMIATLPESMLVRVGLDVASALGFAHRQGIIHRDVKPDNVLFDDHGNAVVADFGIARALDAEAAQTATAIVVGTPHYFAPEQARGRPLDGRADLYALGVTLYRAAAGALPFPGDDWFEVARHHVEVEPADVRSHNPAVSVELARVIHCCLEKDPADRYPTAEALHEALAAVPDRGETTGARTIAVPALDRIWTTSGMTARRRRLRRRLLAGAGVATVGAATLVAFVSSGRSSTPTVDAAAVDSAPAAMPAAPSADSARVASADSARADSARADSAAARPAPAPPRRAQLILSAPDGARLYVDRRAVGTARWSDRSLAPGRYVVAAELPQALEGCPAARAEQTVTLAAGSSRTVRLEPAPCGLLELRVTMRERAATAESGARFRVSGPLATREGAVPLAAPLNLPAGTYELKVNAPLCAEFTADVRVVAGERTAKPIALFCDR